MKHYTVLINVVTNYEYETVAEDLEQAKEQVIDQFNKEDSDWYTTNSCIESIEVEEEEE